MSVLRGQAMLNMFNTTQSGNFKDESCQVLLKDIGPVETLLASGMPSNHSNELHQTNNTVITPQSNNTNALKIRGDDVVIESKGIQTQGMFTDDMPELRDASIDEHTQIL